MKYKKVFIEYIFWFVAMAVLHGLLLLFGLLFHRTDFTLVCQDAHGRHLVYCFICNLFITALLITTANRALQPALKLQQGFAKGLAELVFWFLAIVFFRIICLDVLVLLHHTDIVPQMTDKALMVLNGAFITALMITFSNRLLQFILK